MLSNSASQPVIDKPSCMHTLQAALAALLNGRNAADSEGRLKGILYTTFKDLERPQQHMFLDVATVLRGQPKQLAMFAWAAWHGRDSVFWFEGLERRNLLTTGSKGELQMHDVMSALGRHMLLDDGSQLPQQLRGSRLWVQDGALHGVQKGALVLTANLVGTDIKTTTSINTNGVTDLDQLHQPCMTELQNARILVLEGVSLPSRDTNTPIFKELLWLQSTSLVSLQL
eukprot:GHUV01023967.1.p1 GENE.GHUV01023967.1~~GHUV01023967.1.p1  ORF type:complete len:228 (+),score=54.52 GHUV01023967.1:912-1595(+)